MQDATSSPSWTLRSQAFSRLRALSAVALVASLAACNGTSSPSGGTLTPGTYASNPATQRSFFVDANDGGLSSALHITQTFFGRLVSVEVRTTPTSPDRRLIHEEFVISPNDLGDGVNYSVVTNPVNGSQILEVYRNPADRTGIQSVLQVLSTQLRVVADNGFVGAGNYTMVPRNAAFVLQFDDLIDPTSVDNESVLLLGGVPTITPFDDEARVFLDPNHGGLADFDGDGVPEFYSTRVIIDPTISEQESFMTTPLRGVNTEGFPGSLTALLSNVQVRMPTLPTGSSTLQLLRNPSQHAIESANNGTVDFGVLSRPVVRAFRAGGRETDTGDPFNGYLPDNTAPNVVGSLNMNVDATPVPAVGLNADPREFNLPLITFSSTFCAQNPVFGDMISQTIGQADVFGMVLNTTPVIVDANGSARDVRVRLVVYPREWDNDPLGPAAFYPGLGVAPAQFLAPYDQVNDGPKSICFVELSSTLPSADPTQLVQPDTQFTLRFNEPIDRVSLSAYDSFRVTREETPIEPIDFVPGTMTRSVDLQEFTFTPDQDLQHVQGTTEDYFVALDISSLVPTDLAGNQLSTSIGTLQGNGSTTPIRITMAAGFPTREFGGRVIRFTGPDEEAPRDSDPPPDPNDPTIPVPGDPTPGVSELIPEWNGQHVYDTGEQLIRPRPVTRTQVVADRSVFGANLYGNMTQTLAGQSTPLSRFGARTQLTYRWFDFGLPFKVDDRITERLDREFLNIDVEGLSLAPRGPGVVFESYPRFRMTMGHSQYLPDEALTPTGAIAFPVSGLQTSFELNYADVVGDPPKLVHHESRGYQMNPGDLFRTASGTDFFPMPMNRGNAASAKRYYTWRDTLVRVRAAPNGAGVYPARWHQITSTAFPIFPGPDPMTMAPFMNCVLPAAGTACVNQFYSAGNVRTAGLPLLVEFDCFPSSGAQTINVFDTSMAHATQTTPFFRAFSAGGFNTAGDLIEVDPNLEPVAQGGFVGGVRSPGNDNIVYLAAVDLVVRVSRSSSVYYPVVDPRQTDNNEFTYDDPRYASAVFFPALLDPRPEEQPIGTSVDVLYRGAIAIMDPVPPLPPGAHRSQVDATEMDSYGDFYPDRENRILNICDGTLGHNPVLPPACDPDPNGTPVENAGISFLTGLGDTWRSDIAEFNGAQFIQVHLTFASNVETGLTPTLSSLALSWGQ